MLSAPPPAYRIPAKLTPDFNLLVQVRINDAIGPFWCDVDSGGGTVFVLDRQKSKSAGLHPTSTGRSAGVGAAVIEDERLPGTTLRIGGFRTSNQTIVIRPLGGEDCILGTGILNGFAVQIDYLSPVIRLYDPQTFQTPDSAVSVPFTVSRGSPVVKTQIWLNSRDSIDAQVLVDTAVRRFPLALAKRFTDENGLINSVHKIVQPPFAGAGTGGAVNLLATRIDRLSIGSLSVVEPIVILFRTASGSSRREPDGYLGNEFFRRFLTTIDYPHQRLILQPNRNYHDPPAPYDGSGLGLEQTGQEFVVRAVVPESPASKAGLNVGDVVLSFDGRASANLTSDFIRKKLYRSQGDCLLQVRRDNRRLTFILELKPLL